jgi:Ca2+-transporting ATPase
MIIDPACAIIFEMEAPEKDVMLRPPRSINQKFFSLQNTSMALLQGAGLTILVVGLYFLLLHMNYSHAMATTLSFGCLVLGNISLIIVNRSKQDHLFKILQKNQSISKMDYWDWRNIFCIPSYCSFSAKSVSIYGTYT